MNKSIFYVWASSVVCLFLGGSCQPSTGVVNKEEGLPAYEGVWTAPPAHTPTHLVPDGAISGNGDIGMVLGGKPEESVFYFSKNDFWKSKKGYPDGGVCYVGELHIAAPSLAGADYITRESIADATIHTSFTQADSLALHMKAWCAAVQNQVVIELEAVKAPIDLVCSFRLGEGMDSQNSQGKEGQTQWFVRKFEGDDLEWPSAVAVAMTSVDKEWDGSRLSLKKGEKATLILSFCSNHDQRNYQEEAVNRAENIKGEKQLAELYQVHRAWWCDFWQASQVTLHDSFLEKYYYGSQYLLACCSRDAEFAPGLWGTSLTMDATAGGWAGDYHLNYNHQAPWWGAYSSNHVELTEPYDTPILEYMSRAKVHAQEYLHQKGVYYPVGIGPKGFCSSMFPLTPEAMMRQYGTPDNNIEGGYMFLGQKSNAVFATANMFMRYYHTYDRAYAEKVYPFIREVADFWEDYLVYENGRYVSYADNFWEVGPWEGKDWKRNYGDINPTVSLGLVRMLYKGIIDMSQFLNIDQERVEKWNHILTHLSAIPTVEENGVMKIKACEGGNGSGSRTAPGLGRVMMHGLLFPSGVCGVVTDSAFANVLRKEIERWDEPEQTGYEWYDSHWDNLSNGIETYFTSAVRTGYDGNKLLEKLKERIQQTAYPNLWIPQGGGGIESLSAVPSCINEMLLQGYEGMIRVFPVWPKEKPASFRDLRTYGAFLVSSSCEAGRVKEVSIFSEQGRPCRVENPWGEETACRLVRADGKEEVLQGEVLSLQLSKGEKVILRPEK